MSDALPNALPNGFMVLCHSDGRVTTADREAVSLFNGLNQESNQDDTAAVTIAQIAAKADCAELVPMFEQFAASGQAFAKSTANCGAQEFQVLLRRLNGFHSQPLIALELNRVSDNQLSEQQSERALNSSSGQLSLLDAGSLTFRLIHDFKNQMGGLKLYAAYLKKKFAGHPDWTEGLEITDKIIQSLNEMAENASLVGKLSSPIELKLGTEDFAALVKQVIEEFQSQVDRPEVRFNVNIGADVSSARFDLQQMRIALKTLIARAAELSPLGGKVTAALLQTENEVRLSILSEGASLDEPQRQAFFDFLTNERLNKTSLNLAQARRIIEAHGGSVSASLAQPTGIEILVRLRV